MTTTERAAVAVIDRRAARTGRREPGNAAGATLRGRRGPEEARPDG